MSWSLRLLPRPWLPVRRSLDSSLLSRRYGDGKSDPGHSSTFEAQVDEALESLHDQVDDLLSRSVRLKDYDVSLNVRTECTRALRHHVSQSGVLTVNMGHLGTYVLNKQSANRQLWLSSPVRSACFE